MIIWSKYLTYNIRIKSLTYQEFPYNEKYLFLFFPFVQLIYANKKFSGPEKKNTNNSLLKKKKCKGHQNI
jgi:hypothetical protein